jgi:hypothetical protein
MLMKFPFGNGGVSFVLYSAVCDAYDLKTGHTAAAYTANVFPFPQGNSTNETILLIKPNNNENQVLCISCSGNYCCYRMWQQES